MATMRAYTTVEQSRKLAEILPLESADFHFSANLSTKGYLERPIFGNPEYADYSAFYCWSLAALLDFIPKCIGDYNIFRMDINDKDFSIWYDEIGCGVNNKLPDITMKEPVDACYEMILKLKELNLL